MIDGLLNGGEGWVHDRRSLGLNQARRLLAVQIYHLTTATEWKAAQEAGVYTGSTRDVTLEEEGFIHCSTAEQVEDVLHRWFSDVDDLVLLVIDTEALSSLWRMEQLDGADQPFPHIYGPLNVDAVVDVRPIRP